MITRTAIANCDNEDPCPNALILQPQDSQPFRTLTEHGWVSTWVGTDELRTFCPAHGETT